MNNEAVISEVNDIRLKIIKVIQLVEALPQNAEIINAGIKLNESKMELGRVLKELGSRSPYRHGKNPSNEVIAQTGKKGAPIWDTEGYSHIRKIKAFRRNIDQIELELKKMLKHIDKDNEWLYEHFKDAVKFLIRGGMWLGMELGRINMERDAYS